MTSEPDGMAARRPPTIDLTATDVERPASASRLRSHAIGAVIGALATAAIVAGLWFAGIAPERQGVPPGGAAPAAGLGDEVAARLDKIEGAIKAQRQETTAVTTAVTPAIPPAPDTRIVEAQAQTKAFGDSLAALSRRVDEIAASVQTAQKAADAATAAAEAAKSASEKNVQRSDLDALAGRIAALESTVKSLAGDIAQKSSSADDRVLRLTIAAEALRAAVERGAPYQAELAAAKALGAAPSLTAPIEPFAAGGVPGAGALAGELAALTPAMERGSGTAPGDTSFVGWLKANAQRLVRITRVDAPPGNEPSMVIARIKLDAARADIAAALSDIATLPDSEKALTAAWVKTAEARNAAIAASRQLAANALAALGGPASQ